jgi:Tol biopolymer transport system component
MKKSVSSLVRNLSLTVVLIIIAPTMMDAQNGKADFTGTWVFNAEKSVLPQGSNAQRMGGGKFTVSQEANLLTQTRTGQDGTSRVTKYTLDGKESINTTGGGESKSTAKWSADGKALTIVTKTIINGNERNSTSVWSLIDANTLSILITRQNQNGEVKATMVYGKQ